MAGMSEARKAEVSSNPINRGDTRRAATTRSGWSAHTTAMAKAPRIRPRAALTAAASSAPGSAVMVASIRWASTSVSVFDSSRWPAAASSSASSSWFSMIPLWMTARRPLQSTWGWAFSSVGRPWVAHRVWPMPAVTSPGALSVFL